jgi:thioredoxin reductase (NADPH)
MKKLDVVIIGAGPAGLTAGIFAVRRSLKTVVFSDIGDAPTVTEATVIEDWIGTPDITGPELMKRFQEHAKNMNVPIADEKVTNIVKTNDGFKVFGVKKAYDAKTVIIATGAIHRKVEVPGEDKFAGKGVSFCANCDGPLFKGKMVLVVGGGDTAASYALLLNQIGAKTCLIHRRDRLRASENYQTQLRNSKVKIIWDSVLKEIKGDTFVKSVIIENAKTKKKKELPMDGVFIAIGSVPMSEMTKRLRIKLDEYGYIVVDKEGRTNVPGIFAAGDCANNPTKRIITSCADGSKATEAAYEYIQEKELGEKAYPKRGSST